MPGLMYGIETMIWKEKERSRIRAVQASNLRGLLGIRRMGKVSNARIRDLLQVTKEVGQRIGEGVLRWFGHVERIENDRLAKRVYVGEHAGSRSVGRPQKRWIDTVKDCLKKRVLDVGQARRIVNNRSVWQGFLRGDALVVSCYSYMKPLKGVSLSVAKPTT